MSDVRKSDEAVPRAVSSGSSHPLSPAAAVRYRLPQRHSNPSQSPRPPPLPRRRSSVLSLSSIDDVRQSFTDEIINPRTGKRKNTKEEDEVSHWHSTPLAFAILPAIGGLLFKNGSAFVTDVLLLGLAAIFMNWSIRLPWDWYYSAQSLRHDVEPELSPDDVIQEETEDELATEAASSPAESPTISPTRKESKTPPNPQDIDKREEAAADLRMQEILALAATFIFPMMAAYLLHIIRAQLSRPSTGLVSDYNLSIFLLAAEVRPIRQVVRLVGNRTLHLQRTVTGVDDPFSSAVENKEATNDLGSRIAELEAKLSEHVVVPETTSIAQKTDVTDLSSELRKRYEPRLEGLERAVRRYEKRSTTMAIATEQRLQSLETRLQEALSLAAVAAQYSQNRGIVATTLETTSKIIAFPLKVMYTITVWPFTMLEELYTRMKTLLVGPAPLRQPRKKHIRQQDSSGTDGKIKDKAPLRKIVK